MLATEVISSVKFTREFARANKATFLIPPIRSLLKRYVKGGIGWADPFAGDNCLGAESMILKADLTWTKAKELRVGDKLLGFIKEATSRSVILKESIVTKNNVVEKNAQAIFFDERKPVVATKEHPFLRKRGSHWEWTFVEKMKTTLLTGRGGRRPNGGISLAQPFSMWPYRTDWDAGWLSGMYDGEGSVDFTERRKDGKSGLRVNVGQKEGMTERHLEESLRSNSFQFSKHRNNSPDLANLRILGGVPKQLEFLGSIRPRRLLAKLDFNAKKIGLRYKPTVSPRIIKIEGVGKQEISALSTSTGTYIGEGFLCHNSPAEFTNDLNQTKKARDHEKAETWVPKLPYALEGGILDWPYSYRQITEHYRDVGLKATWLDTSFHFYRVVKDELGKHIRPGGLGICFGWSSNGFGKKNGFELIEILMVPHGLHHNDTIVTVEKKINEAIQ